MSVAVDRPQSQAQGRSKDRAQVKVRVTKRRGPRIRTAVQAAIIAIWCLLPFYG